LYILRPEAGGGGSPGESKDYKHYYTDNDAMTRIAHLSGYQGISETGTEKGRAGENKIG